MQEILPMSLKQLSHLDILRRVERHELTQDHAADLLQIQDRTIRRQLGRLKKEGPGFLQHGLKGQRSNNRIPVKEEQRIASLLSAKYPDFGATFAQEKLEEVHGLNRDPKTITRIQKNLGLYVAKRRSKKTKHLLWRKCRSFFGELAQFDGSYHNWFEDRGGILEACLLLAVDDATGAILYAQFAAHEGVLPVMNFWLQYTRIHGIPKAVYLDRFSTYSMNQKLASENPDTLTQFERMGREVGMQVVHAYSPQAKGRVENKFGTLQDRLVKELRLLNISDVKTANDFLLNTFLPAFNKKFARTPETKGDLHRKPTKTELSDILPFIFCRKETRTVRNDFTVSYKNTWLQILPTPRLHTRPKEEVMVHEMPDDSLRVFIRGKQANIAMIETPLKHRQRATMARVLNHT
jgi:transposase